MNFITLKRKGSVSALMLLIGVILLVLGTSILAIGYNSRIRAIRYTNEVTSKVAADAGLTKTIAQVQTLFEASQLDDGSLPSGSNLALPGFDGTYSYTVTGNSDEGYKIVSTGYFGGTQKTSEMILEGGGEVYEYGLLADIKMIIYNSAKIDWYNNVNGDLVTGEDSNPSVVIRNQGGKYTGDTYAQSSNHPMTSVSVPDELGNAITGKRIQYNTTLTESGKYKDIQMKNGQKLTIDGDIELYIVSNVVFNNSSQLIITKGSSLTLYAGKNIHFKNSSKINNQNKLPRSLKIMGTDKCTRIDVRNSGSLYGIIYAPKAKLI